MLFQVEKPFSNWASGVFTNAKACTLPHRWLGSILLAEQVANRVEAGIPLVFVIEAMLEQRRASQAANCAPPPVTIRSLGLATIARSVHTQQA
jgi:hypothetical protein